jgi:uncharacterized protein
MASDGAKICGGGGVSIAAPELPQAAGTLYEGLVMHARMKPFAHRFSYRVFSLLTDLDQIPALGRISKLLSVNRFNIVSFHEADHVDPRISPVKDGIRAYVDRLLETAGVSRPARVLLLAYPRIFGHAFNPISVYYAFKADNTLSAVIYEVRNTFGERHAYVCPVEQGEMNAAGLRQSRRKNLHVSPFIGMGARYDFRLSAPSSDLKLRILEHDDKGPLLAATFAAKALTLSSRNLVSLLVRLPLLGLKVVGLIHFEALRLWLRGAIFHRSPPPPPPASHVPHASLIPGE